MTTEGRKKGKIVITIHRIALRGHHPECHLSLGSSTLDVPTVERYIIKKNTKDPKLRRSTASDPKQLGSSLHLFK
jgi:hypothetical protein